MRRQPIHVVVQRGDGLQHHVDERQPKSTRPQRSARVASARGRVPIRNGTVCILHSSLALCTYRPQCLPHVAVKPRHLGRHVLFRHVGHQSRPGRSASPFVAGIEFIAYRYVQGWRGRRWQGQRSHDTCVGLGQVFVRRGIADTGVRVPVGVVVDHSWVADACHHGEVAVVSGQQLLLGLGIDGRGGFVHARRRVGAPSTEVEGDKTLCPGQIEGGVELQRVGGGLRGVGVHANSKFIGGGGGGGGGKESGQEDKEGEGGH